MPIFSQLSNELGCSHELWCRKCATWLWSKYVFFFFFKLYSIHISKDIPLLRAQNSIKQYKWYFSRNPLCQGLWKYKISKSAIMHGRTAAMILCMVSKNNDLGVGGNCLEKRILYSWTQNHHSEPENCPLTICSHIKLIYGTVFEI